MRSSVLPLLAITALAFANVAITRTVDGEDIDGTLESNQISLERGMRSSGGRTLLQKSPGADGAISGAGSTQSDTKIRASGDRCYISSDTKARLDCSEQGTGTYDQQVPACCTSTSRTSSNLCSTFDNAGSISCNSARVYPACCEYRDQPASLCDLAGSSQTTIKCGANRPAIECCGGSGSTCSFDNTVLGTDYGQYVPRTCSAGQRGGCCPA